MDQNQTDISKYIDNLPKNIQDVIYGSEWEQRVGEISKKYSLSQEQSESLSSLVLMVLVGMEQPENLLDTLIADLSVSRLLAEQLMNDLEDRVFDYALNLIENKDKKISVPQSIEKMETKIPEIRPENLPMVEERHEVTVPRYATNNYMPVGFDDRLVSEKIKETPQTPIASPKKLEEKVAIETPKPLVNTSQATVTEPTSRITYTKTPEATASSLAVQPETVQRPVFVPRFGGTLIDGTGSTPVVMENKVEAEPPTPNTPGIIENKLAAPTGTAIEKPEANSVTPPSHNYVVDPYREPLE